MLSVLRLCGGICPEHILDIAALLNNNNDTIESNSYPFYNVILSHLFRPEDGFVVCPQWTIPGSRKTIDFVVAFIIDNHPRPLLLVEVKAPSHFNSLRRRRDAICQVLDRLDDVGPNNTHVARL
jgi:hypothetical protein